MPWVRAVLRGQKVYAKANDDGSLHAEGGRVAVRYKPNDGREYQARADNLSVADRTLLPDDTCGPAGPVAPKTKAGRGAGSGNVASQRAAEPDHSTHADGTVIAYADGACTGNPGPAGLGVVILDGGARTEISEGLGTGTNNIAELTAIERTLEAVPDAAQALVIYTDSSYAIGVLSKGWKAKANVELVERLRAHLARRPARFVHVRGHAGIPLNERADELARAGVYAGRGKKTVKKIS